MGRIANITGRCKLLVRCIGTLLVFHFCTDSRLDSGGLQVVDVVFRWVGVWVLLPDIIHVLIADAYSLDVLVLLERDVNLC